MIQALRAAAPLTLLIVIGTSSIRSLAAPGARSFLVASKIFLLCSFGVSISTSHCCLTILVYTLSAGDSAWAGANSVEVFTIAESGDANQKSVWRNLFRSLAKISPRVAFSQNFLATNQVLVELVVIPQTSFYRTPDGRGCVALLIRRRNFPEKELGCLKLDGPVLPAHKIGRRTTSLRRHRS